MKDRKRGGRWRMKVTPGLNLSCGLLVIPMVLGVGPITRY